jgi:hypothetical protein
MKCDNDVFLTPFVLDYMVDNLHVLVLLVLAEPAAVHVLLATPLSTASESLQPSTDDQT